jgi:hypothetical protein
MGLGNRVALVPSPPAPAEKKEPQAWRAKSAGRQPGHIVLHKRPARRIRPIKSRDFSGRVRQTRLKQNANALTCNLKSAFLEECRTNRMTFSKIIVVALLVGLVGAAFAGFWGPRCRRDLPHAPRSSHNPKPNWAARSFRSQCRVPGATFPCAGCPPANPSPSGTSTFLRA